MKVVHQNNTQFVDIREIKAGETFYFNRDSKKLPYMIGTSEHGTECYYVCLTSGMVHNIHHLSWEGGYRDVVTVKCHLQMED